MRNIGRKKVFSAGAVCLAVSVLLCLLFCVPAFAEESYTVLITAAGDCTLGGDYGEPSARRFDECWQKNGSDYFFSNVRSIFEEDDFTIVNLEGPLTTATSERANRQFNFRGRPEYVSILTGSSVEVCGVANNHARDFRQRGQDDTVEVLRNAGIGVAGYKHEFYAEKNGVTVGFLAYTEWDNSDREIEKAIEAARKKCDLLIVSFHWGEESRYDATSTQRRLGRLAVDAGADLVLGHHSHVVGGIDFYRGKYIVYSLGNFCFGGNRNPKDKNTMIFRQKFTVDPETRKVKDAGIDVIPCTLSTCDDTNDYRPTPLTGDRAQTIIETVFSLSGFDPMQVIWLDGDPYSRVNN